MNERDGRIAWHRAGPDAADATAWASCTTLAELGDVVARWLERSVSWHPGYMAPGPAQETFDTPGMLEALAACNRAGFVTDDSQAGLIGEITTLGPVRQRAYVSGLALPQAVLRLQQLLMPTDLVFLEVEEPSHRSSGHPDDEVMASVAVTASEDGWPFTFLGRGDSREMRLRGYLPWSPAIGGQLVDAITFQIFDPVWGRNSVLWPQLREAVGHVFAPAA